MESADVGGPDPATLAAFVGAVTIAGGNAPAIRYVSCDTCELGPFWGGSIRFLLAGVILAAIALALRLPMPRGRALQGAVLFGVLQFGVGFGLIYWGLVRAPAGLAQVLIAAVPLLTFGLAMAHRQERFRWGGLVGSVVALGGVAVVFSSGFGSGVPLPSMLAVLLGAAFWAEAIVVVKAFPRVDPTVMNAVAMIVGSVVLFALATVSGQAGVIPEARSTLGAQSFLITGSVVMFWLFVFVVSRWTATAASYQLVLVPLVTVPVAAWLHSERISPSFAAGSVLVLIGVYVGALRRPAAPRRALGDQAAVSS